MITRRAEVRGPAEGGQGQGEGPGQGEIARAEEMDYLPLQLGGREERQGDRRAARGVAGSRLLLPLDARGECRNHQDGKCKFEHPKKGRLIAKK